jgi:chromosomal replication initiator protein
MRILPHYTDEIKSKSRKKEIVIPRQMAMYFAKEFTDLSLVMIGTYLGRDHSTVIHAISSVENMRDTDRKFKVAFSEIEKKLKMKSI